MAETAAAQDVRSGDSSWWRRVTVPPRLATLLLVAVTTAGATFTIVVAGGAGPQALPVRIVYDVMAALVLIPWLVLASVRPEWRPSSRLMPALVVVLGAFVVATITSRLPRLSIEMLGYAYLLAGVYLLLVTLMRRPEIRAHFERLALVLCVVMCGLYLLQVFQLWVEWWGLVGGLAIPPMRPAYVGVALGSPNPLATLVLILGAFALATTRLPGRRGQVVAFVIVGLVSVATFITTSRGAWLGVAVGLVVTGGAVIVTNSDARERVRSVTRSRSGTIAALLAVGVLALAGTAAALTGRLTLADGGYRAGFAQASLRMIESAPITGVGPGTWAVLRAQNMNSGDPDQFVAHAHNVYLQTLAEFGVVGVLAAVVLAASLVILIATALRSDDRSRRRVAYACLFGVVVFAAQQVADVLVNVPALLLALALPIAWLDATAAPSVAEPSARPGTGGLDTAPRAVTLAAAVLTAVVVIGLLRVESAAATAEQGVTSATAGDWHAALGQIGAAVAADPDLAVYQFERGISAANVGDWDQAEQSLSISARTDDYPYAWLNLAAVRWKLGDDAGAREALARAERQGLQRTPIALAAGWLHQQLGNDEAARVAYATAIAQEPTLVDDPFWSSSSAPPGGMAAILPLVNERASPAGRLEVDLFLGRFDEARAAIAALDPSGPGFYAHLIPAWQGDPSAWAALQAAASSRPLDVALVDWCRLVAARLGDPVLAQRYASWLSIVNSSDSGLPAVARIVLGSAQPLPVSGLDRYGAVYRRELPAAQVVGFLPQMVWTSDPSR